MNRLKIVAVTGQGVSTKAAYGAEEDVKKFLLQAGFDEPGLPGQIWFAESGFSLCAKPADENKFFVYHQILDSERSRFKLVRLDGDKEVVIDQGCILSELSGRDDIVIFEGSGQYLPKWRFFCDKRSFEGNVPEVLSPFQRVAAHPKGALAILRFLRGALASNEKEMELAMYEVTDIYDEVFDKPAMMPRFMAEMLHGT